MTPLKSQADLLAEITAFLQRNPQKSYKTKELARELGIAPSDYLELRKALRALLADGKLLKTNKNRYAGLSKAAMATGLLRVNAQGNGFLVRDDGGEDVFVSAKNRGSALHKDRVQVRLLAGRAGDRQEGVVVDILSRGRRSIVGTFRWDKRYAYVVPDDIKIQTDIIIPEPENSGAQDGHKVVAVIDAWPHAHLNPEGHITHVLGFGDEPGVDILSIVHGFDLNPEFPGEVMREVENLRPPPVDVQTSGRLDCRDWLVFTIDPADAKDFDDAVSLHKLENGNWLLGVHIADVSHYVTPGSLTDAEALRRGTSIYLVDRVIPMLPERLSNEWCSLREGEDKFCFSVLLELTPAADLVNHSFHETIIRSQKRYAYEEAQSVIEGTLQNQRANTLREMLELSRQLIKKREGRGSIDFESMEVEVVLDEEGHPVELRRRQRLATHRLIEEFMLLANETVARHVGEELAAEMGSTPPFVYRVHEKPSRTDVLGMLNLAQLFGFAAEAPKRITPHFFQRLAKEFQRHPAGVVLQDALLRAMTKAKYTTGNAGHFGLSYKFYTHFTSPIRRYPDLMVHRLLKAYLKDPERTAAGPLVHQLESRCKSNSESEVRAQEAERASIKMKQIEYMEKHLGEVHEGYISRILAFGVFVTLPEFMLDGLVHISELGDDYYLFDEAKHHLVGQHTGKIYRLGDKVSIRISRVDRNERLVDFILVRKENDLKRATPNATDKNRGKGTQDSPVTGRRNEQKRTAAKPTDINPRKGSQESPSTGSRKSKKSAPAHAPGKPRGKSRKNRRQH